MNNQQRSILIFSKDRALQLEATLNSFFWATEWDSQKLGDALNVHVLYKSSNPQHEHQYDQLRHQFPGVIFQSQTHFYYNMVMRLKQSEFILMMVDDNFFVRQFNILDCFKALVEHPRALTYSLRLGLNTRECYMMDGETQALPSHAVIGNDQMLFEWQGAEGDFGYPFDVSCSIHRSQKLLSLIGNNDVILNPNQLEHTLMGKIDELKSQYFQVVSFDSSVSFSLPLNLVQDSAAENRNLADSTFTADALFDVFENQKRIHWEAITGIIPKAAHQIVAVEFVDTSRSITDEGESFCTPKYPLVTVIIPCYNYGHYVREAAQSVVQQIYPFVELIIVDGGSDDKHTIEVLREMSDQGLNVQFREGRHLAGDNRNFGISQAKGELICCLDADDRIAPDFILKTVLKLITTDSDIVGTAAQSFGSDDAFMGVPVSCDYDSLLQQNELITAALYKKSLWELVGGYDDFGLGEEHIHEDWHFWVKCASVGALISNIPDEALFNYRVHDRGSLSKQSGKVPNIDTQRKVILDSLQKFKNESRPEWSTRDQAIKGLDRNVLEDYRKEHKGERLLVLVNLDFIGDDIMQSSMTNLINRDYQITAFFENISSNHNPPKILGSEKHYTEFHSRDSSLEPIRAIEWLLGLNIFNQCSSLFSESYHARLKFWKATFTKTHFSERGLLNRGRADASSYLPELWEGYSDPTTRSLKIEVCADKNALSQGEEIWILSMRDPEGNEWVAPEMQPLLPTGWSLKPNNHPFSQHVLYSRGVGKFEIRLPVYTQITFLMHPHSGQLNLISEDKSEKVDLYSAEAKLFQYIVE